MRLIAGHQHPQFDLNGGMPAGHTTVIRAAKDPIAREPEDPRIIALLRRTLCRATLSMDTNSWRITGVEGGERDVSLGATFEEWVKPCEELLTEALKNG